MSKQSQEGGDGSTNIQANNVVMQVGIDEKRAREVFQEMNLQLRREYTQEALDIANKRVSDFENSLMPKMEQVEGALEAFADPSFQLLIVEAQKTAASTERPADYDLLSELLVHRFQKGSDRVARAGICLAVEIVDKISDEALLGLTVAHAINNFLPASGDILHGLNVLNDLFGKIMHGRLPNVQEWLDHLDILSAARISTFGGLKKVHQYYPETLSGYTDVGIEKDTENHKKAIEILLSNNLPPALLVDHALNPNYQRIPVVSRQHIKNLTLQQQFIHEGRMSVAPIALTHEQVESLGVIYDLYSTDGNLKKKINESFMSQWNERPHLNALREWWDDIPMAFQLTSAGKVLAHSNAQRCDSALPPMD